MGDFPQIKETKGTFEVRGVLFNLKAENAFKEIVTTSGKKMRMSNLGLRLSDSEVMFISLNGMEQDNVYFSKQVKKGEKPVTEKVEWAKRDRWAESHDGYRLIGVGLALAKESEDSDKNVPVVNYTPFDAVNEIQDSAQDGMSVFVKGKIEFSSYADKNNKDEIRHSTKFIPTAIYLAQKPIDFQATDFVKSAEFAQPVIFEKVNRESIPNSDNFRYTLDVATVGYKSYEEATLECTEVIATAMKSKMKPNQAITVTGRIESTQVVETETAEVWGEESKVGKPKNTGRVVLKVTGARPETINVEDYTKKIVDEYRTAVEAAKKSKEVKEGDFETQESGWGEKSAVKAEAPAW
jgi:hypothetical protein